MAEDPLAGLEHHFSPGEAARFKMMLERHPKWIVLLVKLKKLRYMSIAQAKRVVGMKYSTLMNALTYLSGRRGFPPLVSVEAVSRREKYILITDEGDRFVKKALEFLKEKALRLGAVNLEEDLGVSKTEVLVLLQNRLPGEVEPHEYIDRLVDWFKIDRALFGKHEALRSVLRPDILEAVPVRVGRKTLYVII